VQQRPLEQEGPRLGILRGVRWPLWALLPFCLALGVLGGFALDADDRPRQVVETVYEEVITVTVPRASGSAPAPTSFATNYDARQVPLQALVPRDANVLSAWYPAGHIVVAWDREDDGTDSSGYRGLWFSVWRRSVGWRSVYRARYSGYELAARPIDLTGDGRSDFFSRVETGGTAGCGVYRVVALARRVRQIYVRKHCLDQGVVTARRGQLVERDGLQHIGPGIHCCYRFTVTRVRRWDGEHWVTVSRRVRRNPNPLGG
jgi:hypothetical protein